MSDHLGFTCSHCGDRHTELPMGCSTLAPDAWDADFETDPDSMLSSDQCVITGRHFFIRGLTEIPLTGSEGVFSRGVRVSLGKDNFARALEMGNAEGREAGKPYFGRLSTGLALYSESTTHLKTNAHTGPIGRRPFIELEPTDRPLAVEQRTGITYGRMREIATAVLHQVWPHVGGRLVSRSSGR